MQSRYCELLNEDLFMKHLFVFLSLLAITFFYEQETSAQSNSRLYPFSNGSKYGLVDAGKNLVVDYIYDYISVFRNGAAVVKRDNKYGLISARGKEIVPPRYDYISMPVKGFSIVSLGDSSNVIDTSGNPLSVEWFHEILPAGSGFFRLVKFTRTGSSYIKKTIIHFHLENSIGMSRDSVFFSEFLIGYLSPTNHNLDNIWFSGGETVADGSIKVAVSKHTYLVDTSGNLSPRSPDPCDRSLMNIFRPDQGPVYPGGNDSLSAFLKRNFKYPVEARVQYHNAKVVVAITIDKEGKVCTPRVVKSVSPEFDDAVINVLMKLPPWQPAKYNDMPVCWEIEFPFTFTIPGMN